MSKAISVVHLAFSPEFFSITLVMASGLSCLLYFILISLVTNAIWGKSSLKHSEEFSILSCIFNQSLASIPKIVTPACLNGDSSCCVVTKLGKTVGSVNSRRYWETRCPCVYCIGLEFHSSKIPNLPFKTNPSSVRKVCYI